MRIGLAALLAVLPLLSSSVLSQPTRAIARGGLTGRVVDREGNAVSYAHIFEVVSGTTTVASGSGEFVLAALSDSAILVVRRIGYRPLDTSFVRAGGQTLPVVLTLDPITAQLTPVTIRARTSDYDEYLDRSGFYRRMSQKMDGTFLSGAVITKRNAVRLTSALRDVPGIRVRSHEQRHGRETYAVLGRGGICSLGLVVDGQRIDVASPPPAQLRGRITSITGTIPSATDQVRHGGASLDELVPASMVAGIEIYPSASSVPSQLAHHVDGCGLMVVWTKYRR